MSDETTRFALRSEDERMRMAGVRVAKNRSLLFQNAEEHRDEHLGARQLLAKSIWYWDIDRTILNTDRGFKAYTDTLFSSLLKLEALPEDILRTALSEMRACTLRGTRGEEIAGG